MLLTCEVDLNDTVGFLLMLYTPVSVCMIVLIFINISILVH